MGCCSLEQVAKGLNWGDSKKGENENSYVIYVENNTRNETFRALEGGLNI